MLVEVSIIIPAYNIAPYIGKCLESVLVQTLKNIEVIVVDDGSNDNTAEVIRTYADSDKRVRLLQKVNGGVTSARLTGIQVAEGEYIGFVDGDDTIDSDMFERLLNNARKYHADISHCGYQMVFPNRVDYYYNTGRLLQQDNTEALKDLISGAFVEPGLWNKLFHRKLFAKLLQNNLMDSKIKYNEDLLMNYYLFRECSRAVYEDWCPYQYLVRNNSATSASISVQKLTDPIKVSIYLERETKKNRDIQQIALKKLAYQLVNVASMDMQHHKEFLLVQKKVRNMLRKRLLEILKNPACSKKEKTVAVWGAVWPWSYGMIHKAYARIKGIDKKYSVD